MSTTKTVRYHVRDLGPGLLEPGGINRDGAATFTAVVEEFSTFMITAVATVANPTAPVLRFPNEAAGGRDRGHGWEFFGSHAGAIDRGGGVVGWAVTAAPLGTSVVTEAVAMDAGHLGARLPPVAGFTASAARAVGLDGVVVGDSAGAETSVATAWRGTEAARLDGGLPGATFSRAVAINCRGTVLGFFQTRSGAVRGWLRDANGGVEPDVGPTGIDAFPSDLNDSGRVVGAAADQRGWFAQRSGSATRLALLPGTAVSAARGVNNPGVIVGDCDGTACLWQPDRGSASGRGEGSDTGLYPEPVDLNGRCDVPDRGRLHRAVRISDAGLILCEGSSDRGQRRVYLLAPYATAGRRAGEIPEGILFGLRPRAGIFGVQLSPDMLSDGTRRGCLPLSKVCQLVSALDCPTCLRLVEAPPCGTGWGIAVEGIPEGMGVTLMAGDALIGELAKGPARADETPFSSQNGRDGQAADDERFSVEIVFTPRGDEEYFLLFEETGPTFRAKGVFAVRLTVFRADDPAPA